MIWNSARATLDERLFHRKGTFASNDVVNVECRMLVLAAPHAGYSEGLRNVQTWY